MIYCPKCNALIQTAGLNSGSFLPCPVCQTQNQTWLFPEAVNDTEAVRESENLMIRDDAGCFYHPTKQAVIACDACGRFLCALCDVEMDGEHICFSCISAGKEKKTIKNLENSRFLYDALAVRLALFPVVLFPFWFFSLITAPAGLYISIRHWNSMSSIVPRRKKLRFVVAILVSAMQIAAWGVLVYFFVSNKWD